MWVNFSFVVPKRTDRNWQFINSLWFLLKKITGLNEVDPLNTSI